MNAELESWLRLIHHGGLGRRRLRQLLAAFGSPQAVLAASPASESRVIGERGSLGVGSRGADADQCIESARQWLAGGPSRCILSLDERDCPATLLESADAPLLLYVDGRPGRKCAAAREQGRRYADDDEHEDAETGQQSLQEFHQCTPRAKKPPTVYSTEPTRIT